MRHFKLLVFSLLVTGLSYAQVGIGTESPDASSLLDLSSTSQGLLAPRMTTLERTAIASPAESLMVFDTDEAAFFYYNTASTSWIELANNTSVKRDNYKLIKSEADLAPELAAGGSSYLLDTNTLYEINGTIVLTNPINLNNAYISGQDVGEDILTSSGVIFEGNTGGSIRNLTLKGAKAFNITGPGIASSSSLIVQNLIVDGMTTSVGSISGIGLYFGNINQYINNADGITFSNIGNLLLNTQGWLSSNEGTFETFTGNFGFIEKASGFSTVNGSDVALDVSDPSLNVGEAVLTGTVFSGTTSNASGYINGYSTGSYDGYYFSADWTVDSPGIPLESDAVATGDINLDKAVGSGELTTFSGTSTASRIKVAGTTTSNNLLRFTRDGDNKIIYKGHKTRYFQVASSVSYQSSSNFILILYIAKNGVVIPETKVYGYYTGSGILALPVIGTVELEQDDYIEIYAERYSGSGNMLTVSFNLTAR
ncbi:hypothetical protein [uncultured Winogradskyella sp.]|uniref:hypothetical protein n=1 Tax=uncultured Winogradskyella sp. TaxID=395353 RepID=UPI002607AA50|nr:hypothetical protein [uncultured Winogradskyella sp.]|tara:strand:+ start:5039 stop:6484 length:1446 start_codon:yes stop_codon:yes gene_type:complete